MSEWIKTSDQEYPNNKQQFMNYENTRTNVFLGVVIETHRNKIVENVLPLQLWVDEFSSHYWTIYGETERVTPIKWCLMPKNDN